MESKVGEGAMQAARRLSVAGESGGKSSPGVAMGGVEADRYGTDGLESSVTESMPIHGRNNVK